MQWIRKPLREFRLLLKYGCDKPLTQKLFKPLRIVWNLAHYGDQIHLLVEQNRFLLNELQPQKEKARMQMLNSVILENSILQTKSSFDYQWHEMPSGTGLADDPSFYCR
jgi:hypothetical protein